MTPAVPVGRSVTVAVPASSANLGPGFDSLGLALDWVDEVEVTVLEAGCEVLVTGEGAGTVPRDRSHLVLATLEGALTELGLSLPGVRLRSHNTIPHGRGLGSSSAALVAGLLAGWTLAHPREPVDRQWLLQRAHALEGHADNVAAAIFGGLVLTWSDGDGAGASVRPGRLHPALRAVALVPEVSVLTEHARGVLPAQVPHRDAAAGAGRAALLVHALAGDLDVLVPATRDWLHQDQRAPLMPAADGLRRALRAAGFAALVSGAGPTVLVLVAEDRVEDVRAWLAGSGAGAAAGCGVHVLRPGVGARVLSVSG
ncbi:homoserine kinase [Auraticoccus monumenti]|uniref:Homoserine kinase n=1 Tax=Auraticoccus monumenti TaxID=675864 RepID=A0A1G7AWX5_9ACTN|nr:homoserine kinase [Auraticoccus monumenti]SDE19077.1 homoserine kinase [Auraticoccus monumenti]